MKYLFFLGFIFFVTISSCKKNKIEEPGTAHSIDMFFLMNSSCIISGNFPTTTSYSEAYFTLAAASLSSFPGSVASPDIRIEQAYEKYAQDYFSLPLLKLSEGSSGL